jgi:glycosyltransferase involved in cell wall biosynthesis
MTDRIWITWEIQRRNRTLSARFNAKLYEFEIQAPALLRYPIAISKTIGVLINEKPHIIFVQNPSLILASLSLFISQVFTKALVIDTHNAGLFPIEGQYRLLNWLASKITSWGDLSIVSNNELEKFVVSQGGKAISIPDPVPDINAPESKPVLKGEFNLLFICSWAKDEPYEEVLRAAECVDKGTYIYVTGNSKGREKLYGQELPENVVITGYVSEEEFAALLYACDSIMVLTRRENCLLCGAYEGVAAGKPLIVTNTLALKTHFNKGCVFTKNNAEGILEAIDNVKQNYQTLTNEIASLKSQLDREFKRIMKKAEELISIL